MLIAQDSGVRDLRAMPICERLRFRSIRNSFPGASARVVSRRKDLANVERILYIVVVAILILVALWVLLQIAAGIG